MARSKGLLWNLQDYTRRLGFNRQGEIPEVAFGIQPVLIAGDSSELSSPLLSPFALFGAHFTSPNFQTPIFGIRSLAPGGSFIVDVTASNPTTRAWSYEISDTPLAFNDEETCVPMQMGPEDCDAIVRVGNVVRAPTNTTPTSTGNRSIITGLYLPMGRELIVYQNNLTGIECSFFAIVSDRTAAVPL